MSSNIVHSQFLQSSPQQVSTSILAQPNMTEEPSLLDQYNKRASSQSFSSIGSESSTSSETQQPQQPQPQQKQSITQPSQSPSRTKKLVDKFATFSPRTMKNKSDRQLIVETAYSNRNAKRDSTQSSIKSTDSVKHSKKKKRAPINITEGMSRADIFAANVASAVDAAEDVDEEEDYIYSNSHSRTSSVTSLTSPQSQTIPFPHMPSDINYGYPYHYIYGTLHRPCNNQLHRPPFNGSCFNSNNTSGFETDEAISNQLNRAGPQNNLINPNKPTGVMRSSLPDMSQYVFHKKGCPNYGPANYPYSYWYDDNERLPLFAKWRPPGYETQRPSCAPKISSITAIVVFLLASSYLIYYATTRPLAEVSIIGITNVLAADKELMFNIHVKGRNSGLLNIEIVNANLNVFATPVKSGEIPGGPGSHWDDVKDDKDVVSKEVAPSEFLGSILSFDEPLVFVAGINRTGVISEPSGQVRLQNPGGEDDKEGQDRWSYIIRRQYDLTVRGFLEYNLPFSKNRVTVCFATRVDNASGGGIENGDDDANTKDTNSDILGACGDWDKEQDKKDE